MLGCWNFRRLTLLGKITVLKSLVTSQLVYIFSSLQTNHEAIKEINTMFYKFLWNDKGDNWNQTKSNDYPEGGLKMIDIASFNKSILGIHLYLGQLCKTILRIHLYLGQLCESFPGRRSWGRGCARASCKRFSKVSGMRCENCYTYKWSNIVVLAKKFWFHSKYFCRSKYYCKFALS